MKRTTEKVICDICGEECRANVGVSMYVSEYLFSIVITIPNSVRECLDICTKCNGAIMKTIVALQQ